MLDDLDLLTGHPTFTTLQTDSAWAKLWEIISAIFIDNCETGLLERCTDTAEPVLSDHTEEASAVIKDHYLGSYSHFNDGL